MAEGHGNTYIADYFVLSLKTVRNHVSNVMHWRPRSSTTTASASWSANTRMASRDDFTYGPP
jgi:hypothetical protein